MINKTSKFDDPQLERQFNEIVSKQFAKYKEVSVTFSAADTTTKADVGFRPNRFIVVDRDADIRVWRVSSDDRFAYLKASGAGTATIKFFRGN